MTVKILLFIPCYNCGPQVGRVLGQLAAARAGGYIAEALVLDNGSSDDTVERARAAAAAIAAPPVVIARNQANYHLGGSHKAAFAHAAANGFSHVLVLHGDDQGRLDDILPVLEAGEHLRQDACLGARFMPGSSLQGYSRFRRFGNRVFNLLFSVVSRNRVRDLGSGLNLFGAAVFADPWVARASDDLRFNVYLLLRLMDRRRRVAWFPISWREDDQVSNVRLVSQTLRTLGIAWDYLARRDHFRGADHRDHPRETYGFEVLWRSAPGG